MSVPSTSPAGPGRPRRRRTGGGAGGSARPGHPSDRPSGEPPGGTPRDLPGTGGAGDGGDLPPDRFLNRELSWLDFNERVLSIAEDGTRPLLERLRFLAIFARNLDEFYMVRVAGLKRRQSTGLSVRSVDGLSTREQLARINARTQDLVARHARCFATEVGPALEREGFRIARLEDLDESEREQLHGYFDERVFPVLTPLAVDPAHPFPYISGLSLNLAVTVRDPGSQATRFARVKVPDNVPRFVPVTTAAPRSPAAPAAPESGAGPERTAYVPLEELIAAHLPRLFPGMEVVERHVFRVTRNADLDVEEDRDEDLLQAMERELVRRRFGPAVRLEVTDTMAPHVLDLLVGELGIHPADVTHVPGLLDLAALGALYEVDRPDLKDETFVPATQARLAEGEAPANLFATVADGDVVVHHPYDSFATSVQRFVEQAAADPNVLAIKQTLYRTSGGSPVVDALIDAAEAGKQVVVLVEVKARFDELANIEWARTLERAGCHVVYGLVGLKTHCKVALVVRREGDAIRRYCHIGTGNYNPKTARQYEDLGLLTADPEVGADLTDLFNVLTGYSRHVAYRTLMVAPQGVRQGILDRIEREIGHARAGRPSGIRIKVNALVDETLVDALYRAAGAGVDIDLVVRGICALRPGVEGLSERIRVRSIVSRFLEHSRILHFVDGGAGEFWVGSADLMHRNLDRRVEVLVRVTDPQVRDYLSAVLDSATAPDVIAWELGADGGWRPTGGRRDHQRELVRRHTERGE